MISINLQSVVFIWYVVCFTSNADHHSGIYTKICVISSLPNSQGLTLIMLNWVSFSGFGREHVAVVFASEGWRNPINGCLQPIQQYITHNSKLNMVDSVLTLNLWMWQWQYRIVFPIYMGPICRLCRPVMMLLITKCIYQNKNLWLSTDAHLDNGEVTVSRSGSLIKDSNLLIIHSTE